MKLLQELNQIEPGDKEFLALLEDLGNLKILGAGKMINVFKQSFRKYGARSGELTASAVGKKFDRGWNVGPMSRVVDMGVLNTAPELRNVWKDYDFSKGQKPKPAAAAIYFRHKPIAIIVSSDMYQINDIVGISWDFEPLSYNAEKANFVLDALPLSRAHKKTVRGPDQWVMVDADTRKRVPGEEKPEIAKQSRHVEKKSKFDATKKAEIEEESHYEGIAVSVRDMMEFLRRLIKSYGPSSLTWKLVRSDVDSLKKRGERIGKGPEPRTPEMTYQDVYNFKASLIERLKKYKASKLESVNDVGDFIDKVFGQKAGDKITLAGRAYNTLPKSQYLGMNKEKGAGSKDVRHFYNNTMRDLFAGKTIALEFEEVGGYSNLIVYVQLKNKQITPVKARYTPVDSHKTETVDF